MYTNLEEQCMTYNNANLIFGEKREKFKAETKMLWYKELGVILNAHITEWVIYVPWSICACSFKDICHVMVSLSTARVCVDQYTMQEILICVNRPDIF
jgi:hypothetical protein